jgi:hypothetical protein
MDSSMSPFRMGLQNLKPTPSKPGAAKSAPIAPKTAIPSGNPAQTRKNPFLLALDSSSPEFGQMYGKNQPLEQAMFLGYHNGQPMYGGSKLFILY